MVCTLCTEGERKTVIRGQEVKSWMLSREESAPVSLMAESTSTSTQSLLLYAHLDAENRNLRKSCSTRGGLPAPKLDQRSPMPELEGIVKCCKT